MTDIPVHWGVTPLFCYQRCFKRTGSRFSACSLINMLFFCRDMLYRLCKKYDHVIMLSKNQSTNSPGSHLISLGANSCKLINHGIKPSGQQQIMPTTLVVLACIIHQFFFCDFSTPPFYFRLL